MMIRVRSNCPLLSALMRKYVCRGMSTFTPLGTYTKLPPDHTALFTAANLLSSGGTIVAKCSRNSSGYSFRPSSMLRNTTPSFSHSSLRLWYTISDSYCAPTPASAARSASGMPRRSKVSFTSVGTSSQLRALKPSGLM